MGLVYIYIPTFTMKNQSNVGRYPYMDGMGKICQSYGPAAHDFAKQCNASSTTIPPGQALQQIDVEREELSGTLKRWLEGCGR